MNNDEVHPPIHDGKEYNARWRDIDFINISEAEVKSWEKRHFPFGMSQVQFGAFVKGLANALRLDGVCFKECDIRLQGSSAFFYSGHHKPMVTNRDSIIDNFRLLRNRLPDEWEVQEITTRLQTWIKDDTFPSRRPFDSMHKLGIDRHLSDYDLQISCDYLVDLCKSRLIALGQKPTELRIKNNNYAFVQNHLVEDVAPFLYRFTLRMSDALMRDISIALFEGKGPPKTDNLLSSHFKDSDWILSPEILSKTLNEE